MADADLGHGELDLLEDALEQLELDDAIDRWSGDELDPRVIARLHDYRSVLEAAREALPFEDVPAGVLDGVLEQARQAAAAPAAAVAAQEPWWARLRRSFMVPVLALAGTAALVFWVFDPEEQTKLVDPPAGSAPAAERAPVSAKRAEAGERQQAGATPVAPAAAPTDSATAASDADAKAAPPPKEAELERDAAEAKLDAAKNEAPNKPAEGLSRGMTPLGDVPDSLGGAAGAGGSTPGQAQEQSKSGGKGASSASGRWDIVVRGDRARQAGDCVAAREEYAVALEDDEARVRARAFAGLGLCDAAAGDEASADANYERARSLDDEVASFIDSQNDRSRGAAKKKGKPKKSKAQVDAFDDAADPFQ